MQEWGGGGGGGGERERRKGVTLNITSHWQPLVNSLDLISAWSTLQVAWSELMGFEV